VYFSVSHSLLYNKVNKLYYVTVFSVRFLTQKSRLTIFALLTTEQHGGKIQTSITPDQLIEQSVKLGKKHKQTLLKN
jgi:hypothetical protein